MAVRVKDLNEMTLGFQEGFNGTSAVNEATPTALDTVIGLDTHVLRDARTIVPKGARFTTVGVATIREVTATQNSQQWTLDLTAATAGTYTITVNGQVTAAIAFDDDAAAIVTALELLSTVGAGDITVTGTDPFTITMALLLKNSAVHTLTVDGSGLTAADSEVFTVVQTGLVTWEVTFTPALATPPVVVDDDAITWYPRRLVFEIETGDAAWTEGANPLIRLSRGIITGLRRGEEQPLEVSMAFVFDFMRASGTLDLTPWEVLHQLGEAADWMPSSHGGVCEPPSVDIFIIDKPICGSELAEVSIFPQFAFQSINPSVNDGIVNFNGVCVAKFPIVQRVANNDDAIGVIF